MKHFIFGAPTQHAELERYIQTTSRRHKNGGKDDPEGFLSYAHRLIDRQLNKARGILTFNAFFLSICYQEKIRFSEILSIISCLICLYLFFVKWSKYNNDYSTFESEARHSLVTSRERAFLLTISIAIYLLSAFIALVVVFVKYFDENKNNILWIFDFIFKK